MQFRLLVFDSLKRELFHRLLFMKNCYLSFLLMQVWNVCLVSVLHLVRCRHFENLIFIGSCPDLCGSSRPAGVEMFQREIRPTLTPGRAISFSLSYYSSHSSQQQGIISTEIITVWLDAAQAVDLNSSSYMKRVIA